MIIAKKRRSLEELSLLKKFYPLEGEDVYKRLPGHLRNVGVSKASKLGLVYGEEMYHGLVLSDWITRTVTENIKEIDTSMLESKVLINLDGSQSNEKSRKTGGLPACC